MYKKVIIIVLLILLFFMYVKCKNEHLTTGLGYANRFEVSTPIDQTYGGTDKFFHQDVRFGK
jgi:hypothetical protein